MGLPTTFDMDSKSKLMYILPIVSLALPQVANLMKWLRRYMIDQMNSDYVKFARSGGLTEGEIFTKHILKNAAIPIVQGVPASVLFALTGAIITERVYVVPGAGNLLTEAISKYVLRSALRYFHHPGRRFDVHGGSANLILNERQVGTYEL